jgi:ATP-dependent Lon protease
LVDAPPVSPLAEQFVGPQEGHLVFHENQRGVDFDTLFGPYLKGARTITVTDPYIRVFHQARNLMELIETIARVKAMEDEVAVHLVTGLDEQRPDAQLGYFEKIAASAAGAGIVLTWEFDGTGTIHARHVITDTGWKISLDRGLDVFGFYEMNDAFALNNRLQKFRGCKAFEITYIRL